MTIKTEPQLIPLTLGVLVALLGLSVLVGWHTHNDALIQLRPNLAPMQYNTALCMLLSGIGVILMVRKKVRLLLIPGTVITLIGGLTLLEYLLAINIGIDEIFFESYIRTRSFYLGRMSPNTSLCYVLIGVMFIGQLLTRQRISHLVLAMVVIIISLLTLLDYFLGAEAVRGIKGLTDMAAHTAAGFLLVGSGASIYLVNMSDDLRKKRIAASAMLVVIATLTTASFMVANRFQEQQQQLKALLIDHGAGSVISDTMAPLLLLGGLAFSTMSGLLVFITITASRRNYELHQSEGRLNAILVTAPDGILSVNVRGKIISANSSIMHIFGYKEAELVGRPIEKLIPLKYHRQHSRDFNDYVQSGASKVMAAGREVSGIHKDGHEIPLEIGLSRTLFPDGTIHITASVRDITKRKETEALILANEAKFRAIYEGSPDAYLIMEIEGGKITDCNKATERMLQGTKEQILNLTPDQLSPELQPNGRPSAGQVPEKIEAILSTGTQRFEWTHQRLTGESFPCDVNASVINYEGRQVFLVSWRDMSKKKKLEAEREKFIEKLADSNTQLERFAYIASHDMQEPIRLITNFGEILQEEYSNVLDEPGQEYIDLIVESGKRMRDLINDLLSYSRVENEGIRHQSFDGETVVEGVLENLKGLITEQNAEVSHDNFPTLYGNPVQVMRVIQNLVTNAIKYQPEGNAPRIHIGIEEQNRHWCLSVKDNGLGIDDKFIEQIFQPFRRLHTWEQINGTGLGLSICRKIVETHGGKMYATSKPNEGSTFSFTLQKQP